MRYIFGDYILDTDRHELFRNSEFVKLRPKVFRVLSYLVVHHKRMVAKSELLETIWPSFVGEEVLNSSIMAARRAVGDDGRTQGVIKTIHGVGYRFVAPIQECSDDVMAVNASAVSERITEAEAMSRSGPAAGSLSDIRGVATELSAAPTKELKTVTVLACEIAHVEALADRLGPETLHEFMETFFTYAGAVMERHEGSIVQRSGEGFLALFGAPIAHEDDARRAVLSAFELNAMLNGRQPPPPDAAAGSIMLTSIGLHTGPLVVGGLQEGADLRTFTARGKTTDLAAQLQSEAAPGTILASESTFRLVNSEVDAETLVRGTELPPAYRLTGVSKRCAGVPQRSGRRENRFVGRREELAILRERFARATAAEGQVVGISGAAGIGKSRLLQEFCDGLSASEVTILKGQCLPYGKSTPYLPLVDMVRRLSTAGGSGEEEETDKGNRISIDQEMEILEADRLLPELLGAPIDSASFKQLSPQARRARTFTLLEKLVFAAASVRPTVLLIEDYHWIDATSAEWLDSFTTRLNEAATLLIVTYRPPHGPGWIGRSAATQLALPPLTLYDSTLLVRSILRRIDADQKLAEQLATKAAGNPFFLEELSYALDTSSAGPELTAIPDTVQAVLAARIDRLDTASKRLLQTCSVIGTSVPFGLLRHITDLDKDIVALSLGNLEDAGFLIEIREAAETAYRFKHALTQEATYQSVPPNARASLHARIAAALEAHFDHLVADQPEMLARHHTKAGNVNAAIRYWQRAGRAAYERSANIEAIDYSTEGLRLLDGSDIEGHAEKELSLQLTLAPALMATKGYGASEVEPVYKRARFLCEQIGNKQQLFRTLIGLWNFHWVRGELDTGRDVATELLDLAESAKDPVSKRRAHAAMGEILFHIGELEASQQHLQRGLSAFEAASQHSLAAQIPEVVCLCYAAWARWHLGSAEDSLVHIEQAVDLARDLSHPMSLALCLALKAELHQFRLEIPECLDVANEAVMVSREQRLPFWEGTGMVMLGWARAMDGDYSQGRQVLENGIKVFAETGARVQRATWLGMLAEIHGHAGRFEDGLDILQEALSWADRTGERHYQSELHRIEGVLLWNLDQKTNAAPAENALRSAIAIARKQGARMREMRAITGLAEMMRDQGRSMDALKFIRSQKPLLDTASGAVDVTNARALFDSLG